MFHIERILCAVNFSEHSIGAFEYAQSLAHQFEAKLVLLHVVELFQYPCASFSPSATAYDEFVQELVSGGEQQLRQFAETNGQRTVQLECVVRQGMVADSILSFSRERAINLIVTGTHGRRGLDRLLLGSVAERLLKTADCPVLAVGTPVRNEQAPKSLKGRTPLCRILYCTDFAGHPDQVLEAALCMARAYNSELTMLHVIEGISSPSDVATRTAEAIDKLERLIPAGMPDPVRFRTVVRLGKPYKEIVEFASDIGIDLIIVGTRGRDNANPAVFGSTAYRIIQLGSCPVLAIRS